MDVLWSPWRYDYISSGGTEKSADCVFCAILQNSAPDEKNFILLRAEFNFIVLNIYPYGTGHLLVVPYDHVADLDGAAEKVTAEMMSLTRRCQTALRTMYAPDGFNLGMNIGKLAGAGVAGHIHMHILPRWGGDVNFLTSVGQTRTVPEALDVTYAKLFGKI